MAGTCLFGVVITLANRHSQLYIVEADNFGDAHRKALERSNLADTPSLRLETFIVGETDRKTVAKYDRKALAHEWWDRAIDCRGSSADDTTDNYFEVTWAEHGDDSPAG